MKDFGELKQKIQECRYCQRQFGYEPHPVVWGKPHAKIMQISQAPSLNVHNTLKPFNDLSGKKLREEWYDMMMKHFMIKIISILLLWLTVILVNLKAVGIVCRQNAVVKSG